MANHVLSDNGQYVVAMGAEGSYRRAEAQYPVTIAELVRILSMSAQEVYSLLCAKTIAEAGKVLPEALNPAVNRLLMEIAFDVINNGASQTGATKKSENK